MVNLNNDLSWLDRLFDDRESVLKLKTTVSNPDYQDLLSAEQVQCLVSEITKDLDNMSESIKQTVEATRRDSCVRVNEDSIIEARLFTGPKGSGEYTEDKEICNHCVGDACIKVFTL